MAKAIERVFYVEPDFGDTIIPDDADAPACHGISFRFATPENDWENLFAKYIPSWLSVSNKSILQPYYVGESTSYIGKHIQPWVIRNRSGHESISVCIVNSIHIYTYFGRCDQATG